MIDIDSGVIQPVLQYGGTPYHGNPNGGDYWAAACYYLLAYAPGDTLISTVDSVNPGDTIFGRVTSSPYGNGATNYSCSLIVRGAEHDTTGFTADSVPELDTAVEMLEAYPTYCSDYPYALGTRFQGISIQTTSGTPGLSWIENNRITDCNQQVTVPSNENPGGEVDVYYATPGISGGPSVVEVAGWFYYYAGPLCGSCKYQWSLNGSQFGTGEEESLYVDASSNGGLGMRVTDTIANLQGTAGLEVSWDPIASAALGQMDGGEEPCIWIGAPLASDGYDPGGVPPYVYQWSSSDGALSQTDSTSNTADTAFFYDYNDDPPNGPSSVTVYLTVSDTGTQASASQYESSYDCPNDQRPKVLPSKTSTSTMPASPTAARAAVKPRGR